MSASTLLIILVVGLIAGWQWGVPAGGVRAAALATLTACSACRGRAVGEAIRLTEAISGAEGKLPDIVLLEEALPELNQFLNELFNALPLSPTLDP
jgi:hypothetical protein